MTLLAAGLILFVILLMIAVPIIIATIDTIDNMFK